MKIEIGDKVTCEGIPGVGVYHGMDMQKGVWHLTIWFDAFQNYVIVPKAKKAMVKKVSA